MAKPIFIFPPGAPELPVVVAGSVGACTHAEMIAEQMNMIKNCDRIKFLLNIIPF